MPTVHAISSTSLSYTGEDDETIEVPTLTISSPYPKAGELCGGIPLDAGADGFYCIPFGAITNATRVRFENNTGGDLDLSINGSGCLFTMPDGSYFEFGSPAHGVEGTWLQSIEFIIGDPLAAPGNVASKVFGYADD